MATEVRIQREGTLRWVQAGSGTGNTVATGWITAANPVSGLVGYVAAGLTFDRVRTVQTIMDRGLPKHHKMVMLNPVELDFTVLFGITADIPGMTPFVTASGFSLPEWHWEFKMHDVEQAGKDVPFGGTGIYYQFHNGALLSDKPTEAEMGNSWAFKVRALAVVGPTGSGFLS